MIILGGNPDEFIDLSNFERGKYWGMGAPTIAGELSTGSRSTAESWSEMTNQFGFHRFSKIITGNIANIVTEFELDYDDGSKGTLWMPYEMRQFEFMRRGSLLTTVILTVLFTIKKNIQINLSLVVLVFVIFLSHSVTTSNTHS